MFDNISHRGAPRTRFGPTSIPKRPTSSFLHASAGEEGRCRHHTLDSGPGRHGFGGFSGPRPASAAAAPIDRRAATTRGDASPAGSRRCAAFSASSHAAQSPRSHAPNARSRDERHLRKARRRSPSFSRRDNASSMRGLRRDPGASGAERRTSPPRSRTPRRALPDAAKTISRKRCSQFIPALTKHLACLRVSWKFTRRACAGPCQPDRPVVDPATAPAETTAAPPAVVVPAPVVTQPK